MPSGPLGLAATSGFFFPLGVLPPPLFPSRRPPGWPGPSWPGGSPPCGLFQSFPPPLHPPRRRRPRRCHRARCRAAGPDPPPPEVPLPAPPPSLGPPPGRSHTSVDPLRPASSLLRLRCRGLRPPLSQLPRPYLLLRWRPPSPPRFPPSRGRSPISRIPDGSEASSAPLALLRRFSGTRGPVGGGARVAALRAVAIGQLPPSSRLLQRRSTAPRRSSPPPRAVAFASPLPAPLGALSLRRRAGPVAAFFASVRRLRPIADLPSRPPASGAPVGSCWRTYLA
ncbi:hornerin-like [Iris pallida]|uniref:Hornerin-like n=1 Tax=Iris pallida TaxID=29817 RepID=A0AAX6DU28_IRIPA|nr:hornerin-like [Iris pallida]